MFLSKEKSEEEEEEVEVFSDLKSTIKLHSAEPP